MTSRRTAFTIVEVLIVIIIVMILMTLLFPAFTGAKVRAKQTVCISNLRQIFIALQLYREDSGEYPPNSFENAGFRAYYPTILECPESRDGRHAYDYLPIWYFYASEDDPPSHKDYVSTWEACRQARQALMPICTDHNHLSRTSTATQGIILVLREGGAVNAVQAPRTISPQPCNALKLGPDFNL